MLITPDQNMRYQQNLSGRRLAIVVLLSTAGPDVRLRTTMTSAAGTWQTATSTVSPGASSGVCATSVLRSKSKQLEQRVGRRVSS